MSHFNFYQLALDVDGRASPSNAEMARAVIDANDFVIDQAASQLNEHQRQVFWCRISDRIRATGTLAMLEAGALLTLFEHTTTAENRGELFENMSKETGISRTQLYRILDAFRCFGRELIGDPETAGRCTCEALKLLAAAGIAEAAREAAVEALRSDVSYRLTIKEAKKLARKFASEDRGDSASSGSLPKTRKTDVLWRYRNQELSVVVQRQNSSGSIDHESVLMALEAALNDYRGETVANHSTNLIAQGS